MPATVITAILVAAAIGGAIYSIIRNRKKGKSSCGCGCSCCAFADKCRGSAGDAKRRKRS